MIDAVSSLTPEIPARKGGSCRSLKRTLLCVGQRLLVRLLVVPILSFPVLVSSASAAPAEGFALHDRDVVVFYGDSITQAGGYCQFVEAYARTRYPSWNLRFFNAGVGGDTVTGGGAGPIETRLSRDVIDRKPTVVTVMLAMNDGRYVKFDPAREASFAAGYRSILARLSSALPSARIYLIQSSPYDDVTRSPGFEGGYNQVLVRMGEDVSAIAHDAHLGVVDFNAPVTRGVARVAAGNPALARQILVDRVHPGPAGHLIMGATLLRAWNAPALVAEVQIDGRDGRVIASENAEVSGVKVAPASLEWTELDRALPLPISFTDGDTELAQAAGADIDSLDREELKVGGLSPGTYILTIDDRRIGVFSDAELGRGVDLAHYDTPMRWQAYQARWGSDSSMGVQRVRREVLASSPAVSGGTEGADVLLRHDEKLQSERSLQLAPKPHRFVVAKGQ